MFSICFMLILIKEFETEQTVPSRWPYKCEISKLFYLPQTLLVNFFKLIPASESLLIPRRELSNPGLQIFAFGTAPGDRTDWWSLPLLHPPGRLISQTHPWYLIDATHLARMRLTWSRHRAPKPKYSVKQSEGREGSGHNPLHPSQQLLPLRPQPEFSPPHYSWTLQAAMTWTGLVWIPGTTQEERTLHRKWYCLVLP